MKMTVAAVVIVAAMLAALAQQSPDDHRSGVTHRGDQAMGFSHERTTHHFHLYKDGGSIDVTANQPEDMDSRDLIQTHLSHIAKMFASGNFNTPMFIHDAKPPGAATMAELRHKITYRYEDTPSGGRVRITTADPEALAAVHKFLRFQIGEHQTGDSAKIEQRR